MWDPNLCEALAEQPLSTLFHPIEWLREWATARRWQAELEIADLCAKGLASTYSGEVRIHSGIHALRMDAREIQLRIWLGQVRALLPIIEEPPIIRRKVGDCRAASVMKFRKRACVITATNGNLVCR